MECYLLNSGPVKVIKPLGYQFIYWSLGLALSSNVKATIPFFQAWYLSTDLWLLIICLWNTALILWLISLVYLRGKQGKARRWP